MQNLLLEKLEKYRSFEYKQLMFSFPLTKKRQGIRPACIVIVEKGTPEIWLNRFGKLEKETVDAGTIVFGLEDAETGLAWDNTKGSTFVLAFPRDYIRIVSYTFGTQRETPSICFHTAFQLPVQGRDILETLRLCASCPEFEPVSLCLLRALLNMVWTLVRQKKLAGSSKSEHTWDQIDAYLEEHLASELSRKHLAFMFKMNPCYISSLCREKTGRTFNSYVNHLRISYALMNIHSNLSLDELAEQCGFRYTNHFIRQFRKETGTTPGKYRIQSS